MQIILCIYAISLVFPPISAYIPIGYISLSCMLLWFFVSFCTYPRFYLMCSKKIFIALVLYVCSFILPTIFENNIIGNRYIGMPLVLLGYIIYKYHCSTGTTQIIRTVMIVTILFSVITGFITVIALINNPYVSRSIKSSGEYSTILSRQGVGGYNFIYFAVMASPLLLHAALHASSFKTKVLMYGIFLLDVFLILKSNYMTALFMLVVMCSTYIVMSFMSRQRNGLFRGGILAIILLFGLAVFPYIFQKAMIYLPERITRVFIASNSGAILQSLFSEFIFDRWPQWQLSIEAIGRAPIFGIAISERIKTVGTYLVGFGQHSFILDTLALYGLIFGVAIIAVALESVLPYHQNKANKACYPLWVSIFWGTIIVYLFNNATDSIALVINVFYPYVRDSIKREKYHKNIEIHKMKCIKK